MNLRSAATLSTLIGLFSAASAVQFETETHCIYLNNNPLCPGTFVDVNQQVTIQAGFIDDSADQQNQLPAWRQETYPLKKTIDQPVPGRSDDIMKVTYKQDNCLYIRVQIYPSWFAIAPPVAVDAVTNVATLGHGTNLNYNDQRVGCPHDPYQGPELANPWNLLGFRRPGHDTPGGTPNHKSGNDFLDKLRGNTEDFTPLYPSETATPTPGATPTPTPGDKKSEVDTPSTVAYNDGTTDTTDASTNLLPQSFGSINLDTDFSSNAGATSQTGSILSFNTGITGDNNAATTNPAIAQPYDTAFVDSSLSGNNENTPQDPSYQAGGDNPFPDYGLNFGFGVKARRSPRDFRLLA